MGHVRLGRLPTTRKWREVVGLLAADASVEEIARASTDAAELALSAAVRDPVFLKSFRLLCVLPLLARGPGFEHALASAGLGADASQSLMGLTAAISREMDRFGRAHGTKTDFGEIAQLALVESLNDAVAPRLPTLLEPDPGDIRRALARLASGDRFGALARGFFARLTSRTLDYYLSRELANHVGPGRRFPGKNPVNKSSTITAEAWVIRRNLGEVTSCFSFGRLTRSGSSQWWPCPSTRLARTSPMSLPKVRSSRTMTPLSINWSNAS